MTQTSTTPTAVSLPAPLDQLRPEQQARVNALLTPVELLAGEHLMEAGDEADGCWIIDVGTVRVDLPDERHPDDDHVLAFLDAPAMVGEMAILDGEARSARVAAHSDVRARKLSIAALERLQSSDPQLAVAVLAALGRSAALKLRDTSNRLDEAIHERSDPRVLDMISRAKAAQREFVAWSEKRVDQLLYDIAMALHAAAGELAEETVAETSIGNVADKTVKNQLASLGVYHALVGKRGSGVIERRRWDRIDEVGSAVGVVFGLVPITNPVATFAFKSLIALKARNALILSPSRQALRVSDRAGRIVAAELAKHGAPIDLVQWIADRPNRETTNSFMRHGDVGLVLATGGPSLVRAAYRSGRPAIGVGSGNAPTLIAADADLDRAAKGIVESKSFDNGLICGGEHNLVCVAAIRDAFVERLEHHGAAVLSPDEARAFHAAAATPEGDHLVLEATGQSAALIAQLCGIERPFPIRVIVVPTDAGVESDSWLSREKLSPVLSLYLVPDEETGLDRSVELLAVDGSGHTAIVHTRDRRLARRFGELMPASRILVNSPGVHGVFGVTTGLQPSLTLGCGTFGGTSTTDNVGYRNLLNVKHLAFGSRTRPAMILSAANQSFGDNPAARRVGEIARRTLLARGPLPALLVRSHERRLARARNTER